MVEVKVKSENYPTRCEICHQSDCYIAEQNYCSRCKEIYYPENKLISLNNKKQHFTLFWKYINLGKLVYFPFIGYIFFIVGLITIISTNQLALILGVLGTLLYWATYIIFLPYLGGNKYICDKFEKLNNNFIVQISCSPRLIQGKECEIDNADDFGVLEINKNYLTFSGERFYFEIHLNDITKLKIEEIGGQFWFTGKSINISLNKPLNKVNSLIISSRMGNTVFSCRRINQQFCNELISLFNRAI